MIWLLAGVLLLALSALYSGSEIGLYSLSRLRVDAAARAGSHSARLIQRLLADEAALLMTLLVGNNLVLQLLAYVSETGFEELGFAPPGGRELWVTLLLTPFVLFLCELLPKDLFRRRPLGLMAICAWPVALSKLVLAPLVLPLRALVALVSRPLHLEREAVARSFGRDFVTQLLEEGQRAGVLGPRARILARNVLELRSTALGRVMVPWERVERLRLEGDEPELRQQLERSSYTRLPVVDAQGQVLGYVHQVEWLSRALLEGAAAEQGPVAQALRARLRPLPSLSAELTVDRALGALRLNGQRIALVGPPERPLGLVTLKDLLETISGDLARW